MLNTASSYSVPAWVRLADADPNDPDPDLPPGNWTAVAQSGSKRSAFYLGYRTEGGQSRWGLLVTGADVDQGGPPDTSVLSTTPVATADVGRWVHLAGVRTRPQ